MADSKPDLVAKSRTKLWRAVLLSFSVAIIELAGGIISNSIAVIADATHDGVDGIGFVLSLIFLWVAQRTSTNDLSFGYKRAEVMGAVVSVFLIWAINVGIIYEAILRAIMIVTKNPAYRAIDAPIMFAMATFGLICNILIMRVLGHDHAHFAGSHGHAHGASGYDHGHGSGHDHDHGHSSASVEADSLSHSSSEADRAPHDHLDDSKVRRKEAEEFVNALIMEGETERTSKGHGEEKNPKSDQDEIQSFIQREQGDRSHGDHGHSHTVSSIGHGHGERGEHDEDKLDSKRDTNQSHIHRDLASDRHANEDINVRSAYAHAVGHVLQDLGVILASILIWLIPRVPMVQLADPICSVLFSLLGLYPTFSILSLTFRILMQGVPSEVDVFKVKKDIESLPRVNNCHELHIWSLSVNDHFCSVHVVTTDDVTDVLAVGRTVRECLKQRYGITHAAVQLEALEESCDETRTDADRECATYEAAADRDFIIHRRSFGSKVAICLLRCKERLNKCCP